MQLTNYVVIIKWRGEIAFMSQISKCVLYSVIWYKCALILTGGSATCSQGSGLVIANQFCGGFLSTVSAAAANIPVCSKCPLTVKHCFKKNNLINTN